MLTIAKHHKALIGIWNDKKQLRNIQMNGLINPYGA